MIAFDRAHGVQTKVVVPFLLVLAIGSGAAADEPGPRRVIYNADAGHMFIQVKPPMQPGDVHQYVDEVVAAGVTTLFMCPNFGQVMNYPTRVGEMFGANVTPEQAKKIAEQAPIQAKSLERGAANLKALVDVGHDPLGLVIERARHQKLEVFITFRLNEVHYVETPDQFPEGLMVSRFWREHPEWRIGKVGDELAPVYREIMGLKANPMVSRWLPGGWDFAVPEVRARRLVELRECCERYPIDGLDLDFHRFPMYFRPGTERANIKTMTAWVRQVREMTHAVGRQRGRPLLLSARIMARPEQNQAIGLDPVSWAKDGLVDLLIASHYFENDFPLPVADYRKVLPSGVPLYASIEVESDPADYRRVARQLWKDKVDGIAFFNFFNSAESGSEPDFELLKELGNPARIRPDDDAAGNQRVLHSNWPRFRGPDGNGHAPEVELPTEWGPTKNLTWKSQVPGVGASSPVVWGDRIFLTASQEKGHQRLVLCINRGDGSIRWQQVVSTGDPGPTHELNQHASSTCVTDGQRVYSFFGNGGLFCHDFEGQLVWRRQPGEFLSIWGTAASPILYGDNLIVNCDQDTVLEYEPSLGLPSKAFLLAVHKNTGETIWQTPRAASKGWSTPVLLRLPDGHDQIVLNGADGVHGYDPQTGRDLWVYRREVKFGEPCPVAGHGLMFVLAGRQGPMFAIRQGGEGDLTDKAKAWSEVRQGRDLASPLLVGNELYTTNMLGIGTCYDALSGKIHWRERLGKGYTASPVLADGRIYCVSRDGKTAVLAPGPVMKVIAVNQMAPSADEDFLASPAVANGQIFIRSDRVLYCVGTPR